ncbi:sirohydrochlorin chelatase [Prochlorococcus sp. MIT 1307]|uniref:sirohydrochlorin chelatase n=1 Tax=Prochlorococcus sp. MIT 1307 TaxID=3096219 RepID=UPI002A75B594|nr:sirohydrochlorin chelatase [Prochlorococcus sp. MIT 1307]
MTSDLLDNQDNSLGILICGHGSRNRLAIDEFANLASSLKKKIPSVPVEYGYLEFARPIITEALDCLKAQSIRRVIAIPAMLFAAGHVKNDIPSLLNSYATETGLNIEYGRELGINNSMIGAAGARVKEAIDRSTCFRNSETLLVVVGRGSSDPDANANVAKITRILVESFGFGWGETVYSGVTFPLVEPGLRHLVRLGFKKIIVFPYFLFSGVLVSRIRKHTDKVAADFPDIDFVHAPYLGGHDLVLETLKERIEEVLVGNNSMNCSLCKYRSSLLGFEDEVSLPQESHHHHVEGLSESCQLCESECTGACESAQMNSNRKAAHEKSKHSHVHAHHHPYPNADHPLGPTSIH